MGRLLGGRYALERRIGEGGMAEVLLARDQARSGAPVVVKRCKAHLIHQPEIAALFLREARLASLIHHPNVVELEATGEEDGQPYLVMEYLQGFTVREIFLRAQREGGVPQDLAAAIVANAARGLHAAHTAVDEQGTPMGLMHRDVSPHNLFVTDSGLVKVLDFGIAKGVNEHTMTRAGHVKGKASYLAPEQLDPDAKIDARADLFSLGIVAWELLTGKRLFRRATEIDTIQAIRALEVEPPDARRARPLSDVGDAPALAEGPTRARAPPTTWCARSRATSRSATCAPTAAPSPRSSSTSARSCRPRSRGRRSCLPRRRPVGPRPAVAPRRSARSRRRSAARPRRPPRTCSRPSRARG
ncbi:MAG: serine/threonine protein kinase [Myxococcales bacterium]|nr:serine/threonine protein kinase [Myxococcales bacterium]